MTSGKKHSTQVNLAELVQRVLLKKGLSLPVTEEEVAAAEDDLAKDNVKLPSSLSEPPDFLSPPRGIRARIASQVREPTDFEQEMARAAREGGQITPELEEKMRRDRIAAESGSDCDNGKE
jgi:hypothetical protein